MKPREDSSPVLNKIEAEHKDMREHLRELHRILDTRADPIRAITAIGAFVACLREHFRHEDEGGFFAEITEVAPRLSSRAEAVSHEHAGLLTIMEAFDAKVRDTQDSSAWWNETSQEFHRLIKELMHHERREQELLQEAYLDDIGTGD